jgi:glucose/arabinose dehydrogenase
MLGRKRRVAALVVIALAMSGLTLTGQSKLACDAGNGGITLPEGFCALVASEGVGSARHLAVAANGDVYVALLGGRNQPPEAVAALRDADGDGKFETKEAFGTGSTTGIAIRNGYLYLAHPTTIERYKMTAGQLKPSGQPEVIVTGLPPDRQHADKGIAFDGRGGMYLNIGAPSNACQQPDRRPGVKGVDPCPLLEKHAGIWKFDEHTPNQTQEMGIRFASGLRQMTALAWQYGALFIAMNNRDQLDVFWPDTFTASDNADRPAEPLYRAEQGSDFGWPYCYYDYGLKQLILNPEYGGDGKTVGRCGSFTPPVAAFPAHWAPVDLMFYTGTQFPAKYRGGAFIAFHGSWNRTPAQAGYNVTFQPFANGKVSGNFEVFAQGFTGKEQIVNPNDALARPDGIAQAPDGSLYIAESEKGKIWRVMYRGGK